MELIDVDSLEVLKAQRELADETIKVATALTIMKSTDGWGILLDTFEDMKEKQLKELYRQRPGDDKAILAAHAVWSATVHALDQVKSAVDSAIQNGVEAKQMLDEIDHPVENEDWP